MKRQELLARLLIVVGVATVFVAPLAARVVSLRERIEIHGRMAASGGWSPDVIQAEVGVPISLRLTSDDVVHGFAVGGSAAPAVDVLPGQVSEITLTFDQPGRYTFYCTRWCGPDHWRMRGTIEVTGPATDSQPAPAARYVSLGLDIDALHPAAVMPAGQLSARRGEALLADSPLSAAYLSVEYYFAHSPAAAFLDLRTDPAMAGRTDEELWDLVAYLWQANTTTAALAEGRALYAANCAACHGESGAGDGVFADDLRLAGAATDFQPPVGFSDPARMLGASPALLQGKILRGGMGTGMPNWGPIFTEQQLWDLVAYLYTFQFQEEFK